MAFGRVIGAGLAGLGMVGAGYVGLAGEDNSTRDESGVVVEAGEVGAFRIRLGDCFDDMLDGDFESVGAVPCTEPHANEVYGAFNLSYGESDPYPGSETIGLAADEGCLSRFEPFVGRSFETSSYGVGTITPSETSWNTVDDREVLCMISNYDGTPKTGSARDTDR